MELSVGFHNVLPLKVKQEPPGQSIQVQLAEATKILRTGVWRSETEVGQANQRHIMMTYYNSLILWRYQPLLNSDKSCIHLL